MPVISIHPPAHALHEAWKRRMVERFAPRAIRKQLAIIKRAVTVWSPRTNLRPLQ
ncbi:MAG: hypothetical protein JST93_33940 [Acidobacteria bacterium]|nr:hypothetical protein [Acidobacteriota bacterium]